MPKNDEDAMWNVESDHKERSYKQNGKTVGDRRSEDASRTCCAILPTMAIKPPVIFRRQSFAGPVIRGTTTRGSPEWSLAAVSPVTPRRAMVAPGR
jgi:hypothetical protein